MSIIGSVVGEVRALAAEFGVRCAEPVVLRDRANLLVHLAPAPVVARVPRLVTTIRRQPRRYLALDVELAGYLHSAGAPVVAPSAELPAGPHVVGDTWCSFWTYQPHAADAVHSPDTLRASLAELHRALADFPGDLAEHGPLVDLRLGLQAFPWTDAERELVTGKIEALSNALAELPTRPLHGDAHAGNVLATGERPANRLLWTDFEDAWRGPIEWDHVCLERGRQPTVESDAVRVCRRLRELHGALWSMALRTGEQAANARAELISS